VAAREDDLGGGAGWPGLGVAPTFSRGLFGTAVTRAVLQALQVIRSGGQAMSPCWPVRCTSMTRPSGPRCLGRRHNDEGCDGALDFPRWLNRGC
jgi:hypothetical protein